MKQNRLLHKGLGMILVGVMAGLSVAMAEESFHATLKKAYAGDAEAQYQIAVRYMPQAGRSVSWLRKAAEQDHTEALLKLAVCYIEGMGVEADQNAGVELLQRAVAKGHTAALAVMGDCYRHGTGVERTPGRLLKCTNRPRLKEIFMPGEYWARAIRWEWEQRRTKRKP